MDQQLHSFPSEKTPKKKKNLILMPNTKFEAFLSALVLSFDGLQLQHKLPALMLLVFFV